MWRSNLSAATVGMMVSTIIHGYAPILMLAASDVLVVLSYYALFELAGLNFESILFI